MKWSESELADLNVAARTRDLFLYLLLVVVQL